MHLDVADPSGRTGAVTVAAADPQGHLTRIRGEDCARLEVERGVRLRLEQDLRTEVRGGELVATVQLQVTPVPGGPEVTVERVDGTVLLSPVDGTAWPGEPLGAPVRRAGALHLDLVPSRCDPHAVAEDKRGTFSASTRWSTAERNRSSTWTPGTSCGAGCAPSSASTAGGDVPRVVTSHGW